MLHAARTALTPYLCRDTDSVRRQALRPSQVLHINAAVEADVIERPPTPYLKPVDEHAVPRYGTTDFSPSPLQLPSPLLNHVPNGLTLSPQKQQVMPRTVCTQPLRLPWHGADEAAQSSISPASPSSSCPSLVLSSPHDDDALSTLYERLEEGQHNASNYDAWNAAFTANADSMDVEEPDTRAAPPQDDFEVLDEAVIEEARREFVHRATRNDMDARTDEEERSFRRDTTGSSSSASTQESPESAIEEPYTRPLTVEEARAAGPPPSVVAPAPHIPLPARPRFAPTFTYQQQATHGQGEGMPRVGESAGELHSLLRLPNPKQAFARYQRDGYLGTLALAGAAAVRNTVLPALHSEVRDAIRAGLLQDMVDARSGKTELSVEMLEMFYPYHEDRDTPYLYPEEQMSLRRCIFFWTARNSLGQHDERIKWLQSLLHLQSGNRADNRNVRRMRQNGRLGPAGRGRDVVTYGGSL